MQNTQTIDFQNSVIRFKDRGKGTPLVLLHGYLEALEVWDDFAEKLLPKLRIVSIDLPGHGQSGIFGEIHSMDFMAKAVNAVLEKLEIEKVVLVGHSMGGYATMAFLELFPEKLSAFSLLHSHPFADPPKAIKNRNREIEIVRQGKKNLLFETNIAKGFANDNLEKFSGEIEKIKQIARKTPGKGIIANLEGMKRRPDRSPVLKKTKTPFLYIIGKKDNYIPFSMLERIEMPKNGKVLVLENSGHTGFVEQAHKCAQAFTEFVTSID